MLLDVDTGVDDALALAYAVARKANVVGVSTVAGNVPIEVVTRNTRNVLSYLGRADIPVHRGASRPLVASYLDATHVHGGNGLGGVELAESQAPHPSLAGPAFIIQSAAEHAGELTLVMLGPLTNLAIALNVRPELVRQVRNLVVMGGSYFNPGNVTPHAEFNVYVDPDAARQVFAADWQDVTLIGLDVTHQTVLTRPVWEGIPVDATGAMALARDVVARTFTERDMNGVYLHDPLAVAVALEPDLITAPTHAVRVDAGSEFRGKTTAAPAESGPRVATSVDVARFIHAFCDALGMPEPDLEAGFTRPG